MNGKLDTGGKYNQLRSDAVETFYGKSKISTVKGELNKYSSFGDMISLQEDRFKSRNT